MDGDDVPTTDENQPRSPRVERPSLGRYRTSDVIGAGGMGEVIEARDEQLGRDVAVKRMISRIPNERSVARFVREARIQGRLDHPAIVPVYELGYDDDQLPFFVMKKLAGTTLASILSSRSADKYPRERLLRALADVCLAIELAHTRGIIHRDIKPANIMLGDFGEVYLLDWGVAKVLDETDPDSADVVSEGEGATAAGTVIGTPGYMAPEQAESSPDLDRRADVFALGCVLGEVLAHPGKGEPPPELLAVAAHATRRERADRIATARELGDQIQLYLDGDRDLALRGKLAAEHLERARRAFTSGDDHVLRTIAIREAGHALALDPKLGAAAELVSRLMLEPPRETPPEVERMIESDAGETHRKNARAYVLGLLCLVAAIPPLILVWPPYAIAFVGLVAINVAIVWRSARRFVPPLAIAVSTSLLIALLARLYGPMLVAPAIAAVSAMAQSFNPFYLRSRQIVILTALSCAAVIVPYLAELGGLVSKTTDLVAGGVIFRTPALGWTGPPAVIAIILYVVVVVSASVGMGHAMRGAQREIRRRLLVQTWQLRQLVAA